MNITQSYELCIVGLTPASPATFVPMTECLGVSLQT